jgi:hypothetical protein
VLCKILRINWLLSNTICDQPGWVKDISLEEVSSMEVGERVTIPFASGEKEGEVLRICEKKVYLKVDFPRHPGKIIKRALHMVGAKPKGKKRKNKP